MLCEEIYDLIHKLGILELDLEYEYDNLVINKVVYKEGYDDEYDD